MTPHILEYRPTCSKQLYKSKHIHEHRLYSEAMLSFPGPRGLFGSDRVTPMLWSMRVIALSSKSYEQTQFHCLSEDSGFFFYFSFTLCVRACVCVFACVRVCNTYRSTDKNTISITSQPSYCLASLSTRTRNVIWRFACGPVVIR